MNPAKKIRVSSQGTVIAGVKWKCPICLLIPSNDIYQCTNGHSLCGICVTKVQKCPSCRIDIGEKKIRNFLAEEMLDSLRLQCCWDECYEELSRRDISKHQENCVHNPDALKICDLIGPFKKKCNFQFTMDSLQDSHKVEQLLEHIRSCHDIKEVKIKLGEAFSRRKWMPRNKKPCQYVSRNIYTLDSGNRKHLFLSYPKFDINKAQQRMFSLMLIQLTPNIPSDNSNFFVRHFVKSSRKPDQIAKWGPDCVPNIIWIIKPIKIDEFLGHRGKPVADQPLCPFRIPVSNLKDYWTGPQGNILYGHMLF